MNRHALAIHRDALLARALPDGSFALAPGGQARPEATAWAAVALHALDANPAVVAAARTALARLQLPDGSVPLVPECPEAAWPTPLAILAWLPDPDFRGRAEAAAAWLLGHPGRHWANAADSPSDHDTSLKGWPWIEGTHSWVEPTAQVMLTLAALGQADAPEMAEAGRMLLDRQLPAGGWNYGNTRVFRHELRPMPECTGHALAALAVLPTLPPKAAVTQSLAYLASPDSTVATPLTATWRAFGLVAWEAGTPDILEPVARALDRQSRYGAYDTPLLAQALAALASGGRFADLTRRA